MLAFEDMQWADTSLLDFVEYLLEWSRDYPLYVITLARPELHERRPGWGAGQRNFTSLYLEPLSQQAMEELLEGLVPGPAGAVCATRSSRAPRACRCTRSRPCACCSTAGCSPRKGRCTAPTGEIETLEVPETLHALIAARLDGVSPEERRLLQDGAVLGKTFTARALAALSGHSRGGARAAALRRSCARRCSASSPTRARPSAASTASCRTSSATSPTRRSRSASARPGTWPPPSTCRASFPDEDEMAEVLASHYLAAFEAAPDADDAPRHQARPRARCSPARASGPARSARPRRASATTTRRPSSREEPLARGTAARAAPAGSRPARTVPSRRGSGSSERLALLRRGGRHERGGTDKRGARGRDAAEGGFEQAIGRLEQAIAQLEQAAPGADLAAALAQLGRMRALSGHGDEAREPLERALSLAERLQLPEVFVEALTSKAVVLNLGGRLAEARDPPQAAAARAQEEQLYASALRAQNNLGVVLEASDRYAEALESIWLSLTLARRRGERRWESLLRTGGIVELYLLGRWEEGLALAAEEEPLVASEIARGQLMTAALIHCEQGRLEPARALLLPAAGLRESDNPQMRAGYAYIEARLLRAEGRPADALAAAERALTLQDELTTTDTSVKTALVEATEAALTLRDLDKAEELLAIPASLDPGELHAVPAGPCGAAGRPPRRRARQA